jgi:hypothetical protein
VLVDDPLGYEKAESRPLPFLLGGEKGEEYLIAPEFRDPMACVGQ